MHRRFAPVALVAAFVFAACAEHEDVKEAAEKTASALCSKMFECQVPFDDPNETVETCRLRLENSILKDADGATVSKCSKDQNIKCRNAIRAAECTTFVTDVFFQKKLPSECDGC